MGEDRQADPAGDLETWSHAGKPKTFCLMAVRVVSESDYRSVVETAGNLKKFLDGVGLFAYTNDHFGQPPKSYVQANYKGAALHSGMDLKVVLYQIFPILTGFGPSLTP